ASFRGLEIGGGSSSFFNGFQTGGGAGAVFVYNLVNLVHEVEHDYATDAGKSLLKRYPVDRLLDGHLLPLQEDLQGINTGIDIRADYRIIRYNDNAARI